MPIYVQTCIYYCLVGEFMYYYSYWVAFIITIVFVAALTAVIYGTGKLSQESKFSKIRIHQEKINKKVVEYLQKNDFNQNKITFLNDYATYNQPDSCKKCFIIDDLKRKICLIDYNKGDLIIVNFEEILNAKIYENEFKQTGAGFGKFLIDSFGSGSNMCKELKLIIGLNKYDIPQVSYEVIFNLDYYGGINKATTMYKECIRTLQEAISLFDVIINKNSKDTNERHTCI